MNPFGQIVSEYSTILPATADVAGAIGLLFGAMGLRMMSVSKLAGEPQTKGYWTFLAGSILVNIFVWLDSLSQSFIGASGSSSLAYASAGSGTSSFIPFAVDTVQIVGVFGFIRGAIGIKDDTRNGRAIPIGQMVFGSLAVQIVPVLHAFGATAGGSLQSFIMQIVP